MTQGADYRATVHLAPYLYPPTVGFQEIVVSAGDPPFLNATSSTAPALPTVASAPSGWYPSSVIVLLSDGENNQNPDPSAVADLAVAVSFPAEISIVTCSSARAGEANATELDAAIPKMRRNGTEEVPLPKKAVAWIAEL